MKVASICSTVTIFLLFLPYLCYDKAVSRLSMWGCEFHVEGSGSGLATCFGVLQLSKYWRHPAKHVHSIFWQCLPLLILSISDKGDSTISQTTCSGVSLPWRALSII